jgi:hypothetical protein
MDSKRVAVGYLFSLLVIVVALSGGGFAVAAEIDLAMARQVAVAEIQRHVDLHGAWGDAERAEAGPGETVWVDSSAVAHNFEVLPAGHVLVAADDRFSPVLLYSTASSFDPTNVDDPASIEAWILPEILSALRSFDTSASAGYRATTDVTTAADETARRISSAWSAYLPSSAPLARTFVRSAEEPPRLSEGVIVGPMMSTRWGQGTGYNDQIPAISGGCEHALTGCVATAFAQVMRYWQWPYNGDGGHSYEWNGQTISADFEQPYDWDFMPASLGYSSSDREIDAVAHFMADVAVAVETDYGCSGSSSVRYGDEILDRFFRYRAQMARHSRSRYSAEGWFGLIQGELDADPPRPMLFSIFTEGWSGHEVVIDGYQTGLTDKVHINMGWTGAYNGYYDITHNFTAAYEWQADYQVLVTGIEPDNTAPNVDAGADQVVLMGQVVTLPGSAVDPDGFALEQIQWIQRSGPLVALSDATTLTTTFTAPQVTAETTIEFQLIVTDPHGARVTDTCTVAIFTPQDHPVAEAGIDQTVIAGSLVALRGSAMASQGAQIDAYAWLPPTDTDQRSVSLTGERTQESSFIAPSVDVDTELVFTFQVTDTSGQTAEDSCLITIKAIQDAPQVDAQTNADEASSVSDGGSRSSGGGPCFITTL